MRRFPPQHAAPSCSQHYAPPIPPQRAEQLADEARAPDAAAKTWMGLGRKRPCVLVEHLYYWDWLDCCPVPVVHALLHNVLGSFLAFALRKITDDVANDEAGTYITAEGRKLLLERRRDAVATHDIGRAYKCVVKHLGLYTFEVRRGGGGEASFRGACARGRAPRGERAGE